MITKAITGTFYDASGTPLNTARVTFRLNNIDMDVAEQEVISPSTIEYFTDSVGELTGELWPNSRGLYSTVYIVTVYDQHNSSITGKFRVFIDAAGGSAIDLSGANIPTYIATHYDNVAYDLGQIQDAVQESQDWATKIGDTVDGTDYSAKYWANQAAIIVGDNMVYKGAWDASSGTYPGAGVVEVGDMYRVSVGGTTNSIDYEVGDFIIYNGTTWDLNPYLPDHTHVKADITDFNDADYATAAQGALADTALQPADVGTAAALDVPATGDAASGEVVKGDDTRLTNARTPTAHTHVKADITDFTHNHVKADITDFTHNHVKADITDFNDADYATAAQGALADTATQPGDLATVATTGDYEDLINKPAGGGGSGNYGGDWDASTGSYPTTPDSGDMWRVGTAGTTASIDYVEGDYIIYDGTEWDLIPYLPDHTHVKADITDFNDADYATAAQGALADTALQPADVGTAAALDVPATGDAASGEVVKGDDTRLTNARTPTAHTHVKTDITDFNDGDYATAAQGALADTALQPADVGTAAALDVPATGDAASGEVVKGDDTRLTNARTPTAHTHIISEITSLQAALDAKANSIYGVVNPRDYGAVGNGTTDDTTAFTNAIAAIPSTGGVLLVPSGTYKLSGRLIITDKPITILGYGINNSILVWEAGDVNTEGFFISQNEDIKFVHIEGLTIATKGTANNTTGILITNSPQSNGTFVVSRIDPRCCIKNVHVKGITDNGTNGFTTDIYLNDVMHATITDCHMIGKVDGNAWTTQGYGIFITGTNAPVEIIISRCWAISKAQGIFISGNTEGVSISESNFIAVGEGVRVTVDAGKPLFNFINNHVNAYVKGIYVINAAQSIIADNLIYSRNDYVGNTYQHINISHSTATSFMDQHIVKHNILTVPAERTTAATYGIVLSGTANGIIVESNLYKSAASFAGNRIVWAQSSTSRCYVRDNVAKIGGSEDYLDQGTNNVFTNNIAY